MHQPNRTDAGEISIRRFDVERDKICDSSHGCPQPKGIIPQPKGESKGRLRDW
jgi:hypothetical protein